MLNEIRQTITECIHTIQLDDRTDKGVPITVPQLPRIDTQKVLRIGFQNAHGAHPTDAHNKWDEDIKKAEVLQIGSFGLSELNTNVQLPLYKRLVKARINGGFLSAHIAMATCKDEQEIPMRKGGVLVAAALGHERRIRQSKGDPDGMGIFTYVTMEA